MDSTKPDRVGDRMLRCLAMPGLTGNEARVLAALAWHDGPGGSWPADDTIAEESGVRYRGSVFAARQGLKRKGRLDWTHGEHTNAYKIAYGKPFVFDGHCPGKPDSALSGKLGNHCPGKPDTNRNEPDGRTEERIEGWDAEPVLQIPIGWDWDYCPECFVLRGKRYKFPPGSENCLVCGFGRHLPDERRCRSPDLCDGIMDERGRCRVCGTDQ